MSDETQYMIEAEVTLSTKALSELLDIMASLMDNPTDADKERAKEFVRQIGKEIEVLKRKD